MAESTATATKEKDADEAPKYSAEELLAEPRLLTGFSRHHLAGALHGVDRKLTVEQAQKLARDFGKHKAGS